MTSPGALVGLGLGWRPELALVIDRHEDLSFVEVIAESVDPNMVPEAIDNLRDRGVQVVVHGVSLGLGDASRPARHRIDHLNRVAERLGAVLVSEHVAFVRAGRHEAGHLLPVPYTRLAAEILIENIHIASDALEVPLALENIASLVNWSSSEMTEPEFLELVLDETGCAMLLDVANIHAGIVNHGITLEQWLPILERRRIVYAHVAGGHTDRYGLYHDTHADPVPEPVEELLAEVAAHVLLPAVMLERDDCFARGDVRAELDRIARITGIGGHVTSSRSARLGSPG